MTERMHRIAELAQHTGKPYTPETLAAFLEVERTMIYLAIRRKELKAFRVGGRLLRIRREDADQWWQSRCTLSEDTTLGEPYFGRLSPGDIDKALCHSFRDARLKQGRKIGTVCTDLAVLRAGLGWARKARMITAAPHVWLPPAPPSREVWLTRADVEALMAGADMPHVRLFIRPSGKPVCARIWRTTRSATSTSYS